MNSYSKNTILWRILVVLALFALVTSSFVIVVQARTNLSRTDQVSVEEKDRFPTYSFLLNSHSSPRPPLRSDAAGDGLRTGMSGRGSPVAIDTARDIGHLAGARGRKRRTR